MLWSDGAGDRVKAGVRVGVKMRVRVEERGYQVNCIEGGAGCKEYRCCCRCAAAD